MNKEKRMVLFVSKSLLYSRAEFFKAMEDLATNNIDFTVIDRINQIIKTKSNIYIRFMCYYQNFDGYHDCDEILGYRDRFIECRLKYPTKPQFSGSLVEYIKKLEENDKTDIFLKSELDKIREV